MLCLCVFGGVSRQDGIYVQMKYVLRQRGAKGVIDIYLSRAY